MIALRKSRKFGVPALNITLAAALFLFLASVTGAFASEIHDLARAGDLEQVKVLVEQSPDLVNALNEEDDTPLHFAAMSGSFELVEFLVSNGSEVDARNNVNQSPLLYAAYFNHEKICQFLLTQGAEADYRDTRGNSPLDFAAREGGLDVVTLLISKGAEIDHKGRDGKTPLWYAASRGHTDIVKLLAGDGANVRVSDDNGETALLAALNGGHTEVAGWLVDRGALVDLGSVQLNSLLIQAAALGQQSIVSTLIDEGAELTAEGESGRNILHAAAVGGLKDLAAGAIDKGVSVDGTDDAGRTPLHYAVSANNKPLAELLIGKGADVNIRAKDGRAPLNVAQDWGREPMVDLLIANGARQVVRESYTINRPGRSGRAEITYIANEGFLVSDGEHKVIIDALVDNPWGYVSTDEEIFKMMIDGVPPFDGLDMHIASHVHADHYNAAMTSDLILKQPGVTFVSNQGSIDELSETAGADFDKLEPRVVNMNPDWGSSNEYSAGGVDAEFFAVDHAGPGRDKFMTLASIVEVGGLNMVHLADEVAETSAEFIRSALAGETIDIAFIDPFFMEDSTGQVLIKETIRPAYIILMHVRESELDGYADQFKDHKPPVVVFREPMEKKVFEIVGND